jgi:4-diphosphocytidyl-2-C-methyl-D-erythritol kinase
VSAAPREVTRRAHAKINVFLRVLGSRGDGYHDVETLVLPISLHDVVTVAEAARFSLEVDGEPAADLPDGPHVNLAGRAAKALASHVGRPPDVTVRLHKRIPIAAGLGGGSADAAATLLALDELWSCGLAPQELSSLGARLGADVPAMLAAEPVLATGRGERLTPVHAQTTWWVLRPFGFGVAAADAYAWWDEAPTSGPDAGVLIAALEVGDLTLLGDALYDDLQAGVVARHPEVGATVDALVDAGALGAIVSGSGPTVAALARHLGHADSLAADVPGSIVVSGPSTIEHPAFPMG